MESIEDSVFEVERIQGASRVEEANPPPTVGEAVASPVVVIEYRQPGLLHRLMPAALVLLAAIAISAFQRKRPVRLIPNRSELVATPAAKPSTPIVAKLEEAKAVDKSLTKAVAETPVNVADGPSDPKSVVTAALKPSSSLFELDPADGLEPVAVNQTNPAPVVNDVDVAEAQPEAAEADKVAETTVEPITDAKAPAAEPSKDDILNDIQREAKEKEAERQRLADLKPQAKALMMAETLATTQASRQPFHDDLKSILKEGDPELYEMVDTLCNRYGRSLTDELKARYYRAQKLFPLRMSRRDEVLAMRKLGLPEPMILDFLVNKALKSINSRSGPSTERDAVIVAAKQLVAIPPTASNKPAAASSGVSTVKKP